MTIPPAPDLEKGGGPGERGTGKRAALLFLDLEGASQIPAVAEPWFLACNAGIHIQPVMTAEDLERAGSATQQAAQNTDRSLIWRLTLGPHRGGGRPVIAGRLDPQAGPRQTPRVGREG